MILYRRSGVSLLGEKERVLQILRGKNKELGDHIRIELQRLIEKGDLFNGEVHSCFLPRRHKKKLVTTLNIEVECAYALCILLADALCLDIDGLFKDSEVRRIIAESKGKREAKKTAKIRGLRMPTSERIDGRGCSTCGKDMTFVGVVDKDTKKWRPLEGMPLSGTLRKYQCERCGHEETNENEGR